MKIPNFILLVFALALLASFPPHSNAVPAGDEVTIRGQVRSGGVSIPQADVILIRNDGYAETTTDENGEFKIGTSRQPAHVLVAAPGKLVQSKLIYPNVTRRLEFKLDDLNTPLSGRIIDNQGMGVANAQLQIREIKHDGVTLELPSNLRNKFVVTATDGAGRFQLEGFRQSLIGSIQVKGASIVTSTITDKNFDQRIVHVAQPARSLSGLVIDRKTKQRVANVNLTVARDGASSRSDQQGEFQLTGLPAFQGVVLRASPDGDEPYLPTSLNLAADFAFESSDVEIQLESGLWVNCQVNDFSTSGPANADVYYLPSPSNENFQTFVENFLAVGSLQPTTTNTNGLARIVAIPGPGIVAVYAPGIPADKSVDLLSPEQQAMISGATGRETPTSIALIAPDKKGDEVDLEFLVSGGRSIEIVLEGSDIETSDPFVVHHASARNSLSDQTQGRSFSAEQFHPGEPRTLLIHSNLKKLGAAVTVQPDAPSPTRVTLKDTGGLIGTVVDETETAQSALSIRFERKTENGYEEIATPVFTDANGKFVKPSLIADVEYRVSAIRFFANQQMMSGAPKMDARWVLADNLTIHSGEVSEYAKLILGSPSLEEPRRNAREKLETVDDSSLPSLISGVVVNESGEPVADATIAMNTWPTQSESKGNHSELKHVVLAQSTSDSNGNFQFSVDPSLQEKLLGTEEADAKNVAIVVSSQSLATRQIPLSETEDSSSLKVTLPRQMPIRGNVRGIPEGAVTRLVPGTMRVFNNEDALAFIAELKSGKPFDELLNKFQPTQSLIPTAGGLQASWEPNQSGTFLVRNIPLNCVFELKVFCDERLVQTQVVACRPMRGFPIKLNKDSEKMVNLSGSRIRISLPPNDIEMK